MVYQRYCMIVLHTFERVLREEPLCVQDPRRLVLPVVQVHEGAAVVTEPRWPEVVRAELHGHRAQHLAAFVRHRLVVIAQ